MNVDSQHSPTTGYTEGIAMSSPPPFKTSKLQSAVALAYAIGDTAPRVVAKGKGALAQAIIDRAQAAGVYVHPAPELVSLLMQVDLDQSIPPNLYIAVAELLAWLYKLDQGDAFPSQLSTVRDSPLKI